MDVVPRVTTCGITRLEDQAGDATVTIAGMVSAFRVIKTKKGSKMAFATIEDQGGGVECVFFPEAYLSSQRALGSGQPLLVRGKLEKKADGAKILAENCEELAAVRERRTREVRLLLEAEELSAERLAELKALLASSQGRCPVKLMLRYPGEGRATVQLGDAFRVVPDENLMQGLEALFRRSDVPQLR